MLCLWAMAGCGPGVGETRRGLNAPTDFNVVLVTFDGLRWQELFGQSDPLLTPSVRAMFPRFWAKVAPRGRV
jgi:hypothetical protein